MDEKLDIIQKGTGIINNSLEILKKVGYALVFIVPIAIAWFIENKTIAIAIVIGVLALALIVLGIFFLKEHRNKIKGTFAVSAFIFYGKENKLLLYKSKNKSSDTNDFFVQPSVFYKKKYSPKEKDGNLEAPYQKILDYLNKDLYSQHLEPVSNLPLQYEVQVGNQKLSNFLSKNAIQLFSKDDIKDVEDKMHKYKDNEISLTPLLTIVEKNPDTLKSSGEPFHIDFYYAFILKSMDRNIEEQIKEGKFKLVSRGELSELIDGEQTHGDLLAIYDILRYTVNKIKPRPKVKINNCTFACEKKTAYWRITENCNCNCQYCFLAKDKNANKVEIADAVVEKIVHIIEDNDIEKLVISGGEPLLVGNLVQIVEKISQASVDKLEISVCTNALSSFSMFEEMKKISKFKKFVISIDGYNQATFGKFKKLKNGKPAVLDRVKRFIREAQENNIKVAVNIILSDELKNSIDQYIALLNELAIEELSISTLIDNGRKKNNKYFVREMNEILAFYNTLVSEKLNGFNSLTKLDFILPSCTYSTEMCECLKNTKLIYISPDGDMLEGCVERSGGMTQMKSKPV